MDPIELEVSLRALQRLQERCIRLRAAIIAEGFSATGDPRYRISRQEVELISEQFVRAVRNNAPDADAILARLQYPDIGSDDITLPTTLDREARSALGEADRGITYRDQQIEIVRQLIDLSELESKGTSRHTGENAPDSGHRS